MCANTRKCPSPPGAPLRNYAVAKALFCFTVLHAHSFGGDTLLFRNAPDKGAPKVYRYICCRIVCSCLLPWRAYLVGIDPEVEEDGCDMHWVFLWGGHCSY